jgi:hypothetical protein
MLASSGLLIGTPLMLTTTLLPLSPPVPRSETM